MASELDKMKAVQEDSQKLGDFLMWLRDEKGWSIAEWHHYDGVDRMLPVRMGIEQILAEYFGIDLNKAEKEKQAILDSLRDK